MKKKKFILIIAFLIICTSCSAVACSSNKSSTATQDTEKEETKTDKDKKNQEDYMDILESEKNYSELSEESKASKISDLVNNKVDYDDKYKERVEILKKERDEYYKAQDEVKKKKLDEQYSHIKIAEDTYEATKEAEKQIKNFLDNSEFYNHYELNVTSSVATIKFDNNIEILKGQLKVVSGKIFTIFQDVGLARSETYLCELNVKFEFNNNKYSGSWKLGEAPKYDW